VNAPRALLDSKNSSYLEEPERRSLEGALWEATAEWLRDKLGSKRQPEVAGALERDIAAAEEQLRQDEQWVEAAVSLLSDPSRPDAKQLVEALPASVRWKAQKYLEPRPPVLRENRSSLNATLYEPKNRRLRGRLQRLLHLDASRSSRGVDLRMTPQQVTDYVSGKLAEIPTRVPELPARFRDMPQEQLRAHCIETAAEHGIRGDRDWSEVAREWQMGKRADLSEDDRALLRECAERRCLTESYCPRNVGKRYVAQGLGTVEQPGKALYSGETLSAMKGTGTMDSRPKTPSFQERLHVAWDHASDSALGEVMKYADVDDARLTKPAVIAELLDGARRNYAGYRAAAAIATELASDPQFQVAALLYLDTHKQDERLFYVLLYTLFGK